MRISRSPTPASQTRVVVLTADAAFEDSVRATFSTSTQIGLDVVKGRLADCAAISTSPAPPSWSPTSTPPTRPSLPRWNG